MAGRDATGHWLWQGRHNRHGGGFSDGIKGVVDGGDGGVLGLRDSGWDVAHTQLSMKGSVGCGCK